MNELQPKKVIIFFLLLPGVLIFVFSLILPLLMAVRFSFFQWSGGPQMVFVGLRNYLRLLEDPVFWYSFKNNLIIVTLSILGQVGLAFVLASLLHSKVLWVKGFHRTVIFFPVVLSSVVIGFLWSMIYSRDYGILNWLLQSIHLRSWIRNWLDDPGIVIYSVTVPLIWQYIGLYLVIFLSAMQGISKEIYEVAEIDGATGVKKAFHITLPLLSGTFLTAIMLCIAGNMKVFDHIYVMTGGGPGRSSMVMAQYAYNNSFGMFKFGYGSAISVGILVLSLTLVVISRKLFGGLGNES